MAAKGWTLCVQGPLLLIIWEALGLYILLLQSSFLPHLYFLHRLHLEQTLHSLVGDFLPKLIYISW